MNEKQKAEAWFKQFKEALPEPWAKAVDDTTDWVKKNPKSALFIGTATGVSFGLIGFSRLALGARWALRNPLLGAAAVKVASSVAEEISKQARKNSGESPEQKAKKPNEDLA
jgi:hypothetical protein